ncbi:MAG: hypothetical protein M3295_08635 [Chloroflexota bacterium]|nr:hypothetical protein [Chloroflexota bacterium]
MGVAIVLTLPLWIGGFLSYAFGLVMLASVISGIAWLVTSVPSWVWLVVPILLVPVLVRAVRRPWTIEAVSWETSPGPEFRGMWWKVRGYRQSAEALDEVIQALRRGTAETCRPAGAAGGPKIVAVPGATRPPDVE